MVRPVDVLNSRAQRELREHLAMRFNIELSHNLCWLLGSNNRLYFVQPEIFNLLDKNLRIDTLGLYIGEWRNKELRLSIEGVQRLGPYASKNVLELTKEQAIIFLQSKEQQVKTKADDGFVLVKTKDDWIGCGKFVRENLMPFISKNRRLGTDIPA